MPNQNNFQFWCPVEISKAIDPSTGDEIMRLGGIASTIDKDSDDEFLDPKGFDIQPLLDSGMVNWHHQSKGQPAAIIGEPSKAELRPDGLYIEADLYPSSAMAREVYELAETLSKDSKKRKLGYSIEGKVIKRKSNDKNSPDYKHIIKAKITGVAITHQPKNPKTFANIIKGEGCDYTEPQDDSEENDEEDDKGLSTKSGKALIKESVDKKLKPQSFSKSEVIEKVILRAPDISIEKAEKIYELIKQISMKSKKKITDEEINKAFETLGLDVIEKAEETEEKEVPKKKADDEEESEETEEKEGTESEENEEVKKSNNDTIGGNNRFDRLEKAISLSHNQNKKFLQAIGVLVKETIQKSELLQSKNEELMEIIKGQEDTINIISEKIEMIGESVPAPRALRNSAPVERNFAKSQEDELNKESVNKLSMSRQKTKVLNILDSATFAKGFDNEFSSACTHFESTGNLPANICARIKNEFNIEIVK